VGLAFAESVDRECLAVSVASAVTRPAYQTPAVRCRKRSAVLAESRVGTHDDVREMRAIGRGDATRRDGARQRPRAR